MTQQTTSVLKTLEREMQVSPILVPGQKKPERTVLADGYVRRTKEQEMFVTRRYRTRFIRKLITWIIVLALAVLLLVAATSVGLLNIW